MNTISSMSVTHRLPSSLQSLSIRRWPRDSFPCFARIHAEEVRPWGVASHNMLRGSSLSAFVNGVPRGW